MTNGAGGIRTDEDREILGKYSLHFLISEVYHIALINSPPMVGKPGQNTVPHLSKCVFVAPDVKGRAVEEIDLVRRQFRVLHLDVPLTCYRISRPKLSLQIWME